MASDRDRLANTILEHLDLDESHTEVADAIVALGWRPPAQVITDPAVLVDLPIGSIVMGSDGDAWRRRPEGWHLPHFGPVLSNGGLIANFKSVTLLYVPAEVSDGE